MVKLKITKNIFFFKGGAKQFDSEIASKFYNYKQMTSNYGSLFPLLNKKINCINCKFLSRNSDFFFSELFDINSQLQVIKSEMQETCNCKKK